MEDNDLILSPSQRKKLEAEKQEKELKNQEQSDILDENQLIKRPITRRIEGANQLPTTEEYKNVIKKLTPEEEELLDKLYEDPFRNRPTEADILPPIYEPRRTIIGFKPFHSKKFLRNLRNVGERVGVGLLATAVAGLTALGIHALIKSQNGHETTHIGEAQQGGNITIPSQQDFAYTVEGVKQDFIQKYLQAYNEMYQTNYTLSNANLNISLPTNGNVFKVDEKLVTRGNRPEQTQAFLQDFGEVEIESGHNTLIQIVVNNGAQVKILGTYDKNGHFLYSGNQLEDLQNEEFIVPELKELGISSKSLGLATDVILSERTETEISTKARISSYYNDDSQIKNNAENIHSEGHEMGE